MEAGYAGHEWYPLRNSTLVGIQTNTGQLPQYVKDSIKSGHQSWRGENNIIEAWNHPNRILAIGSYGLFPHLDESLEPIQRLQGHLGRRIPVVAFPESTTVNKDWDFSEKSYQPTLGVMRELGAVGIDDMIEKGKQRGFDSVTIDIHHMLTLGLPWQEVLPKLLPHSNEIHISVGRIDFLAVDPTTEQKLEDLYFGIKGTEIYQILEMIKSSGWTGRVVTEIPYQALRNLRSRNKDSVTTKDFMEDHRRIVDNLKEVLC